MTTTAPVRPATGADVRPAGPSPGAPPAPAGASALPLGPHRVWPPVVLAPMAGVTDRAYRRLCREHGAGLCVSEMVTSRGLVEGSERTEAYVAFDEDDPVRALQLFGVEPSVVGAAVAKVVREDRADAVDLNVGCPVPKVMRRGGGAALPWKRRLFRDVVRAAVRAADGEVPVTVKMRLGLDPEHLTYRDAALDAQEEGVAWVALHARTAVQGYSGEAQWEHVARLVQELDVPVLGNGDLWEAADALRMVEQTGCAGVVVGRGCLGRPWLFAELAAAFAGEPLPERPTLGRVAATLRRHAQLEAEQRGEQAGVVQMRKHMAWYLQGFVAGAEVRQGLGLVSSLAELDALLARLDPQQPYPEAVVGRPRGRTNAQKRLVLPEGWLDDRETGRPDADAESDVSGG